MYVFLNVYVFVYIRCTCVCCCECTCAHVCEEVSNLGCFSARAILGHLEAVSLTDLECANKAKCIDQHVLPLSLRAEIGSVCHHNLGSSCLKASTFTD